MRLLDSVSVLQNALLKDISICESDGVQKIEVVEDATDFSEQEDVHVQEDLQTFFKDIFTSPRHHHTRAGKDFA